MQGSPQEISRLLIAWSEGDQAALDELMPLVYEELRRIARRQRRAGNHTLQTTDLVHEAFLRLAGNEGKQWQNRAHFFGVAARAMRHILVDRARARCARAGARIRVSVNLLCTSDCSSLWAETVDLPVTDILDLQKHVSEKIAEKLSLRLGNRRVAGRRTSNPQAYEYYAKAMYYFGDRGFDSRSRASLNTAIDLFGKAIELDPTYADARVGLAYAYAWSDWFYEENPEWMHRANEEIRIAEESDSTLPSIHIVRSFFLCNGRGCDAEAATRELLVAQHADPSAAHIELAGMYRRMGIEDKEKQEEEAALVVDPANTIVKDAAVVGRYITAQAR